MSGARLCAVCSALAPAGLGADAVAYCDDCRGQAMDQLEELVRLGRELERAREALAVRMVRNMALNGAELPARRRPALKETHEDREVDLLRAAVERIRAEGGVG